MCGERELWHQRPDCRIAIGCRIFFNLQITLEDQPANIPRTHKRGGSSLGEYGSGCLVEQQHWGSRHPAGSKVERIFARKQDQTLIKGDVGLGVAEQLVEFRQSIGPGVAMPASSGNVECTAGPSGNCAYDSRSSLAI